MLMKTLITLALVGASLVESPPILSNSLRCGSALIEPGDDTGYVLKNCGEPNRDEPLATGETHLNPQPVIILRTNRWRYHRGPGKFPAVLVIGDDGRVEAIQFEKHRD